MRVVVIPSPRKRFAYAVAKVYDEIASKSSFSLSIAEEAAKAAGTYTTATADERAKIEYLLDDFKVTDTPSDDVYDAVAEGMFGGDWHVDIGSKKFLKAFAAIAKKITGGRAGMEMAKEQAAA